MLLSVGHSLLLLALYSQSVIHTRHPVMALVALCVVPLCPTAQVVRRAPRVCHGPLAVSLGAPPPNLPTPPPLNVGRRRLYRRSLDVELGEDDVGDCRRRGTLAPIRSIVGGTVEGTRRSLFPRSLTKRNDAPRYRSLLSQEGSQTCPSMGF